MDSSEINWCHVAKVIGGGLLFGAVMMSPNGILNGMKIVDELLAKGEESKPNPIEANSNRVPVARTQR